MLKKKNIIVITILVGLFCATACSNKKENVKYDYLVLVNKYVKLPDNWKKSVKLVNTKNAWDENIQIEEETYEQ